MNGITFAVHPLLLPPRGAFLLYFAGGFILQGLFCLLLAALYWLVPAGGWFLFMAGGISGVSALGNLIPLRVSIGKFTTRSDGALMLQTLRDGTPGMQLREIVHNTVAMRDLWTTVGDNLTLRFWLLSQALEWAHVGAYEHARQTWEEAEGLPCEPLPWMQAFAALVQADIAAASGPAGTRARCPRSGRTGIFPGTPSRGTAPRGLGASR